jgi:hypothetical protein
MKEYKSERMKKLVVEMGMTEWKDIDELLRILAKYCKAKNFYRRDHPTNYAHDFTKDEKSVINRYSATKPKLHIDDGYMFLDVDGGKDGMIRLYPKGKGNPKWSFWEENGETKIDFA